MSSDWIAAAEHAEEQDKSRGDWPNPRDTEQPNFPWPPQDDPILAALMASARTNVKELGFDAAMIQLAVHCWFEGGIAGYDRGQADARRELGA